MRKFKPFIYESRFDSFSSIIADEILRLIKESSANKRTITRDLNYDEPVSFFLTLHISRSATFSPEKSKAFKQLPWETINFERRGFVIDANSYVPSGDEDPEIEMSIVISPEAEPSCYQPLYFKVLDIIRHEMEHLLQKGANRKEGHMVTTRQKTRSSAEESYQYFLLADEIPSMVSGMHLAAVKKRIPIDVEFEDYLFPFIKSGFITRDEATKVIKTWLDFARQHFPTIKISDKYRSSSMNESKNMDRLVKLGLVNPIEAAKHKIIEVSKGTNWPIDKFEELEEVDEETSEHYFSVDGPNFTDYNIDEIDWTIFEVGILPDGQVSFYYGGAAESLPAHHTSEEIGEISSSRLPVHIPADHITSADWENLCNSIVENNA